MELKSTSIGKRLAQHPYNRVRLLHAGVEVSGDKHHYLIPFNQILAIQCRRGIVWGELEFELPEDRVVRLHGTEWQETQRFYRYLQQSWQTWSEEMSAIAAGVLNEQVAKIQQIIDKDSWLLQQDLARLQAGILLAVDALPLPVARLEAFDDCREPWRQCREWLEEGAQRVAMHNQQWTTRMLQEHEDFFRSVESSPLNLAQSRAVVNGERSLLVLAGAGSGKTSLLVARAGWLLRRNLATPDQILLLAFGRQAAREMDERLRQRLDVDTIQASTFHALALMIIRQGNKKAPAVSQLESDGAARRKLLIDHWRKQCREKRRRPKGGGSGLARN
ncbi:DNA helicase IV [Sodalis praecaptivus]